MKIGIIFAMKEELDALLKKIDYQNEYLLFDLIFYECSYKNINLVLVESGIGKVNSARATQILIDNIKVDYIFNIGVAGSINKNVNICDIVIGNKLVQHDFDITPFNHPKGYIPNIGTFIDADQYLIKIASEIKTKEKTHIGPIASGDIFITENYMSEKIQKKFNALCVEMEGASIAQVCFLSHIPFLVLRSISDSPNGNNKISYDEFLTKSSKTIASFMIKLLNKMIKDYSHE